MGFFNFVKNLIPSVDDIKKVIFNSAITTEKNVPDNLTVKRNVATQPNKLRTLSPTDLPKSQNQFLEMSKPTKTDKHLPVALGKKITGFTKDQYKKTKESVPFMGESFKELVTKPKETANLAGKLWLGNAETLGKAAVDTLNIFNSIAPTYGVDYFKKQKEKRAESYKKADELITVDTSKYTPQEKIAFGIGKYGTGEAVKYALMDGALKVLLAPLAKTKIVAKPGILQHIITDASQKAEMSGLPQIATQLKNLKTTGDVAKDIKAITEISAGAKNLGFKKMLLGSLSEAVSYSSKAMQVEALADPILAKSLYNITKELPQAAKIAANLGSFVAIGQIDYKPEDGARYEQVLKDLAIGATFESVGIIYKSLSPAASKIFKDFKSGSKIALEDAEKLAVELKSNQRGFAKLPGKAVIEDVEVKPIQKAGSVQNTSQTTPLIPSDAMLKDIAKYAKDKNGITLGYDGTIKTEGYSFSTLDKADEKALTMDENYDKMFIDTFKAMKAKYGNIPNANFGGWVQDGKFIVDNSSVKGDLTESLYDGILKKQTAIGNLGKYAEGEDGTINISKEIISSLQPLTRGRFENNQSLFQDWDDAVKYYTEKDFKNTPEISAEILSKLKPATTEAGFVIPKTTAEVKKNIDSIGEELNAKMVDQNFRGDKLNLPEEMTKEVEKRLTALGLEQRTVRTFGEMGDAAIELGSDPKTLLKDVATNRITDAQVIALKNTINNNKQFISQTLERIKNNPEMEETLMGQIDNASSQIDQALGKLVKGGTEAGRAVVAYKILAQNTLDPVFWMTKLKRVLGGKEVTSEMQRIIFDLTSKKDINGLANYVAMNIGSTFSEKAVTLWKAGLLTSPTTHIANVTGNVTMRALMDASDVVALPLDVIASLITGKRTKLVNPSTIAAEISGSLKGVKEAGRYMWTGNYSDQFLKKWDLPKNINFKNKILDTYTKTIFKALGAEDIVFRQMAIEKAFSEQAQLIAKNEKLTGDAFKVKVKELLTTPTNEMVLNAIDAAEYATFQSKSAIGDAVVGAKRALARNNSPAAKAGLVGLEIVAPFTKTPSNIISRIVDFSPAGFIKAIVKAVNPTTRSQKAIVEDLSRAITGSGVMALGYLLAEQGLLTGGTPENAKERSTLYYKGQSSSILINGEWRELKRVSPIGNILIMGADIYDLYQNQGKRGTDLASSAAFSGLQNLTEQSFLRGVSGGLDALMSPDRSAEKFVKQTTASLVPSIVTRVAKSIDPTLRESDNIMEAFQERLPVLRTKLAPVRDIFGEIAKVPAGSKYWFDPFSSKKDKSNEPIIIELTKLKHPIGMPEKTIDGVKMNSYEYSEYQRYNGKMLKPVLNALISSDEYQSLNSDEKKQVIDQAITTIRQGINDTVFPALMMVRYNLDKDTDPGVLRELMRQLDARPGYSNKSDDEKATIMKKFLYGLKDEL